MSDHPRGETHIELNGRHWRVRPSFGALVAAEEELGPLFALVERAAKGALSLQESAILLWHCLDDKMGKPPRVDFCDALVAGGLSRMTPALRLLLRQILAGV